MTERETIRRSDEFINLSASPHEEAEKRLRELALESPDAVVLDGRDGPLIYTLKDADEPYRQLIERMSNPVGILDGAATILYCNGLLGRLLGRKPLKGRNFLDLVTEDGHERAEKLLAEGAKLATAAEFALYDSNGRAVAVHASVAPINFNKQSCVTLVVTALRDIKALEISQAELRRSRAELEEELEDSRLLQSISAELFEEGDIQTLYEKIVDAALRIMQADFASIQMFHPERGGSGELRLLAFRGFTSAAAKHWEWVGAEASRGSSCSEMLRTSQRVTLTDVERCGSMLSTRDLAAYRDCGIRACQTTPLFSRSGKLVGAISTHWRKPHSPCERDARLGDILARLAADLIERKEIEEALRDASRRKDEFLAMLAHELRNPLTPIRNGLHVLERTEAKSKHEKRLHEMMARQVSHLVRLVDDLLEVSRITSGKIELRKQPVELQAVVRRAIETSQPLIEAERHQLVERLSAAPLILNGDPVRLTQVFANILNNSAKYTPPQGRIEISTRREGGDAVISVRDNGLGIRAEMLPRIFDLFTQSDRTKREAQGGIGVGLALARGLVELHGGEIRAYSDGEGRGCEFVVRLPLAEAFLRDQSHQEKTIAGDAGSPRVLVVDDDRDVADSLAMLLHAMDAEVRVAYSGQAALELVADFEPQLVFLDIGMPIMNGYETARRIRKLMQGKSVVIAGLSGWGGDDDQGRSLHAGFNHRFMKPLEIETLEKLLASGCDACSA